MTGWSVLLLIGAYLLGSLSLSHLVARKRGINLDQYGTGQVGAGNLWRITHSWKLGIAVGLFDVIKGILVMAAARFLLGLGPGPQVLAGTATIVGHNWPVFNQFKGGRGIGTALGILAILPVINDLPPWISIISIGIGLVGTAILRSSPLPALVGLISAPLANVVLHGSLDLTLALLLMAVIVIIKRVAAPRSDVKLSAGSILLNRLLFDRDIRDRKKWMDRKPEIIKERDQDQ